MANIQIDDVTEIDLDYLEEIERQALSDLRKVRRHERRAAKMRVTLSENQRDERSIGIGYVLNLSNGGCRIFSPAPPLVGAVYRLSIEPEDKPVEDVRARCLRCVLIRDAVFDTAWEFIDALRMELPDEIE